MKNYKKIIMAILVLIPIVIGLIILAQPTELELLKEDKKIIEAELQTHHFKFKYPQLAGIDKDPYYHKVQIEEKTALLKEVEEEIKRLEKLEKGEK